MAVAKSYRFLSNEKKLISSSNSGELLFEFDEGDIWNSSSNSISSPKKSMVPTTRISRKSSLKKIDHQDQGVFKGGVAKSLPVSIPDWSKILKEENNNRRRQSYEDDADGDEDEDEDGGSNEYMIPPHEYLLARQMKRIEIASSFSVYEGRGRTLKGRDLRRVRNAIWEQTGFQD